MRITKLVIKITSVLTLLGFMASAYAGAPTCHVSAGGNYCTYTGKVQRIYVNSSNTILVYFDTPIALTAAATANFTITNGGAVALAINDNLQFAELAYATALSAQASDRPVTIQMMGTQSGYLKLDRIWLPQSQ